MQTPFILNPGPWGRQGGHNPTYVWITSPIFEALFAAGIAARLHVYRTDDTYTPHWPNRTAFISFQRDPWSAPFARDLNPNALPGGKPTRWFASSST